MCKIQMKFNSEAEREAYLNGYELARKMFKRTHGKWIYDWGDIVCSKCSSVVYQGVPRDRLKGELWDFCPRCGADMREGGEKCLE